MGYSKNKEDLIETEKEASHSIQYCTVHLHDCAASIRSFGLRIKQLRLRTELRGPLDQVLELLASLKYRLYSIVQNIPRLVKVLLDLHYLVGIGGVLVPLHHIVQRGPYHDLTPLLRLPFRISSIKLIQSL